MTALQSHLLRLKLPHRLAAFLLTLAVLATGARAFSDPIHDAARTGDLAKVKSLVQAQPSLVASKDEQFGQTPLHVAAFNDQKAVAEFLLANNADVNALDNEAWSPMHSATFWRQDATADLIAAKGGKDLPATPKPPTPSAAKTPAEKTPPKELSKEGDLTSYSDGTVVDTKTKLMWLARDNGAGLSWPDAKKYAQDSHAAGYTDWRLPTLAELSALYDKSKNRKTYCASAVDEMGALADDVHLPDIIHLSCVRVWTSQERSDKPGSATVYDFHTGAEAARPEAKEFVDTASRVLLVREAKEPAATQPPPTPTAAAKPTNPSSQP